MVRVAIIGGPRNYKKCLQTVQVEEARVYVIIEQEIKSQERHKMPSVGTGSAKKNVQED